MERLKLRLYQQSAIDACFDRILDGDRYGHPLVVLPVGAGKSLTMAELIGQIFERFGRTRIIQIAHVKELLEQNAEALKLQYPNMDVGFYCASLGQKRLHNDVTFASIQSVHDKITLFSRVPDVILIDECHLVSHKTATQYRKFIDSILSINQNAMVIGFTGTAYRADTGRLDEGHDKLFEEIIYEITIKYMIENGYLCRPLIPDNELKTKMITDGVGSRGGDYIVSELAELNDIQEITNSCVEEVISLAGDRKRWFGMTINIEHCAHVRDAFIEHGHDCQMVTGDTPKDERAAILNWFKETPIDGEPPRVLVNVATMNVGFNAPCIDLLFAMRPTRSPVLYVQFAGRGLRTVYAPGYDLETKQGRFDAIEASKKKNCLFLDFGGIIKNLGPLDDVNVQKKYEKPDPEKGQAVLKRCPSCGEECAAAQKYCFRCSYKFPDPQIKITSQTERKNSILSEDAQPEIKNVISIWESVHHKRGAPEGTPPTMKVTYTTFDGSYNEYICFEHTGFAHNKAVAWHIARLPDVPVPKTVEEAVKLPYPQPQMISVKRDGKFWRICDVFFSDASEEGLIIKDFDLDEEIPFF